MTKQNNILSWEITTHLDVRPFLDEKGWTKHAQRKPKSSQSRHDRRPARQG